MDIENYKERIKVSFETMMKDYKDEISDQEIKDKVSLEGFTAFVIELIEGTIDSNDTFYDYLDSLEEE